MAISATDIRQGACYSNGEFGRKWSVWQVTEIRMELNDEELPCEQEIIRFRVLVGKNRRKYRFLARKDFASRVRYEVELIESTWQKIE